MQVEFDGDLAAGVGPAAGLPAVAEDGLVAWEMLQQNSAISVVFTDLSMPNLNGMELLNNIRSSSNDQIANLPVIIMTGHDDTENVKQEVFDAGATDFITKPFHRIEILARINNHIELSQRKKTLKKMVLDKTEKLEKTLIEKRGKKAI